MKDTLNPSREGVAELEEAQGQRYIEEFNAQSRRQQQQVGVDPDLCLRLVALPADDRTPLRVILEGISHREFRTKAAGKPRRHDQEWHDQQVRELHPDNVRVVSVCAAVALEKIDSGDEESGKAIAQYIEGVLVNSPIAPISAEACLAVLLRTGIVPDESRTAEELMDIQFAHSQAMRQAELELEAA